MACERRQVCYQGMVQGVGFRWTACQIAGRYPLTGYVRNRPDGCVEVHAEGERGAVEELLGALRTGPRMARVTDLEVAWSGASGRYHEFEIR